MVKYPGKIAPERLKSTGEFRVIYRDGVKCPGRFFILFYRLRQDSVVRLGVTASRRIGNAVTRNRAKRIMREALRKVSVELNQGVDIITVARPYIRTARMDQILKQLEVQLKRQNLIMQPGTEKK